MTVLDHLAGVVIIVAIIVASYEALYMLATIAYEIGYMVG